MAPAGPTEADCIPPFAERLLDCSALLQAERLVVAFSGGLDSSVLLHLLTRLQRCGRLAAPLLVLHVHHGLQQQADRWVDHCRRQAVALGLPFVMEQVQVQTDGGAGPEAAAREARYACFARLLRPGDVLVLAHHADDQAESILLNLLRGSGPRGLSGMPRERPLGAGRLCRPLLDIPRSELLAWARGQTLEWIEDPSNAELHLRRNFLRHQVLPVIATQWSAYREGLARSAMHNADSESLLTELAAEDLAAAVGEHPNRLRVAVLSGWSEARVCNLLRFWMRHLLESVHGSEPTWQVLRHCVTQLLPAAHDACPVIAWGDGARRLELRRHLGELYLVKPMPPQPPSIYWDPAVPLQLPGVLGTLRCEVEGRTPVAGTLPLLEVRFRHGGERLRPAGRPTKSLKQLLQENAVPPWLRPCVPLIYCDGRLLAVADLCTHADWPTQVPEKAATFQWERSQLHCGY